MTPRIIQCVCGMTVEDFGTHRVEWVTGEWHACRRNMAVWVEALVDDALSGDSDSDRLVAEAVDAWLKL